MLECVNCFRGIPTQYKSDDQLKNWAATHIKSVGDANHGCGWKVVKHFAYDRKNYDVSAGEESE